MSILYVIPVRKSFDPQRTVTHSLRTTAVGYFFLIVYITIVQWKQLVIANIAHICSSSIVSDL